MGRQALLEVCKEIIDHFLSNGKVRKTVLTLGPLDRFIKLEGLQSEFRFEDSDVGQGLDQVVELLR